MADRKTRRRIRQFLDEGSPPVLVTLGTMGAVLESGLPSLAVPLLYDQIWNAYRTRQLGAGLVMRRPSHRSAHSLVHRLVTEERLGENARALAARLAGEPGAVRSADAIDAVLESRDDAAV